MAVLSDRYASIDGKCDILTAPFLAVARERLVRLCRDAGFACVLDVGCGTGALTRKLHDAKVRVIGIDTSPAMLDIASKRLPDSVPLCLGGLPLPFADKNFDAAVLALVLHKSADDPCAVLAEALRVAPCCVVLELRMPERNLDLPSHGIVHIIERLAGKEHYARFRNFAQLGFLRGVASRVGASVVSEETFMAGSLTLALCRKTV